MTTSKLLLNPLFCLSCKKYKHRFLLVLISFFALSACSSDNNTQSSKIVIPSVNDSALPDELKITYTQTCAMCHEKSVTGAPLTGDTKKWNAIMEQGMDLVLARVINGYGGMPPGGQCFECSPAELVELINFMANRPIGVSN